MTGNTEILDLTFKKSILFLKMRCSVILSIILNVNHTVSANYSRIVILFLWEFPVKTLEVTILLHSTKSVYITLNTDIMPQNAFQFHANKLWQHLFLCKFYVTTKAEFTNSKRRSSTVQMEQADAAISVIKINYWWVWQYTPMRKILATLWHNSTALKEVCSETMTSQHCSFQAHYH